MRVSIPFLPLLAVCAALACGSKTAASSRPPAAPTSLSATGGVGQVALSWAAVAGATGYSVSRGATTGGPYAQIATPAGTSYNDTSVSGGTTYYYVVQA